MDKSFQLIVDEEGNGGSNIEHSWSEAPVPLDMFLSKAFRLVRVFVEEQKRRARNANKNHFDTSVADAYLDVDRSKYPFFYSDTIASDNNYRYSRSTGEATGPKAIEFDLSAAPSLKDAIVRARTAAVKALEDSDLTTSIFTQFSKKTLKALGQSPDVSSRSPSSPLQS